MDMTDVATGNIRKLDVKIHESLFRAWEFENFLDDAE